VTLTTWRGTARAALLTFMAASVVVFVAREVGQHPQAPEGESIDPGPRVVVYFFHPARRCEPCNTIEAWAREAVHNGFPEALRDGRLEWRAVDYEEPGNEHYAEEYGLFTSSVVLVWHEGGESTRWKNLQDVWHRLGDREAFSSYVHGEVAAFLEAE